MELSTRRLQQGAASQEESLGRRPARCSRCCTGCPPCCLCCCRRHGGQACQPGVEGELEDGQTQQQVVVAAAVDACRGGERARAGRQWGVGDWSAEFVMGWTPHTQHRQQRQRASPAGQPAPAGPPLLTVGARLLQDDPLQGAHQEHGHAQAAIGPHSVVCRAAPACGASRARGRTRLSAQT